VRTWAFDLRRARFATAVVLGSAAAVTGSVAIGHGAKVIAPAAILVVLFTVAHERLLAWRTLLGLIVLTILFIPIKRYTLPANLPFNLEIYRLLVGFVAVVWLISLLIDKRVTLRSTGLEAPLLWFVAAIVLSILANTSRVRPLEGSVVKTVTFFISFVVVYLLVVTLVRSARDIDFLVQLLAGGGAVLGALAIYE
jgi:hypothetical protein